jgi:hypothetical protein
MLIFELKYLPIYFTHFAGISSHLLLLICLVKDPLKCFRNSATYLITNLAFSDFITCVFGLIQILDVSEELRNVISYISSTVMFASLHAFYIFNRNLSLYVNSTSIQTSCSLKWKKDRHLDTFNMASKLVPVGKISCIWPEPNGQ